MSGLVAFTGPPDQGLLNRMLKQLSHRGAPVGEPLETPRGTLAVCEWESAARQTPGTDSTRCFEHEATAWALCGFVFNKGWSSQIADLESLRGSFSVACLTNNELRIARDPVGCQSLYYGRAGSRWLVASEPKAITSQPEFNARLRAASIAQYLAFSFVPGEHTMLDQLFEVEAGHMVTLSDEDSPKVSRYFRFEEQEWCERDYEATATDEEDWIELTRQHIAQAVDERLPQGEQAVFLSGGLDSSIVAAELAEQASRPVHTFAIHFGKEYPNELPYARAVAEHIGSRHHEIQIQPKGFLPRLRQMIWHLDEPIGDPITQPNYELAAIVAGEFNFVFNGEGGDPLFGGPKNIPMLLAHWYGGVTRSANFREQTYLASYRRAYEEWTRLLSWDVRREIAADRDLEEILTPFFSATQPRSFLNKLMAINIRLKGANLILPKVDRMLAAHGLTPLSPLFDDRLTLLSFQMPARLKLRAGIEKYVLKRAYEQRLPREVIERPKSGMRVPVHFWFQRELKRYARDVLSKRNLKGTGIFDSDRVHQLLRYETEEGPGRYGLRLWMLLTFEIWRRIVIERESV